MALLEIENCQFWRQFKIIIFNHLNILIALFPSFPIVMLMLLEHYCRLAQNEKQFFHIWTSEAILGKIHAEIQALFHDLISALLYYGAARNVLQSNWVKWMLHPNVPKRVTRCLTAWYIPLSADKQWNYWLSHRFYSKHVRQFEKTLLI